jgi:hypothetical protein
VGADAPVCPAEQGSAPLVFRELFSHPIRIYFQNVAMKAILTSRPEVRWAAAAIPTILVAHWVLTTLGLRLAHLLPDSVRTILQLL